MMVNAPSTVWGKRPDYFIVNAPSIYGDCPEYGSICDEENIDDICKRREAWRQGWEDNNQE